MATYDDQRDNQPLIVEQSSRLQAQMDYLRARALARHAQAERKVVSEAILRRTTSHGKEAWVYSDTVDAAVNAKTVDGRPVPASMTPQQSEEVKAALSEVAPRDPRLNAVRAKLGLSPRAEKAVYVDERAWNQDLNSLSESELRQRAAKFHDFANQLAATNETLNRIDGNALKASGMKEAPAKAIVERIEQGMKDGIQDTADAMRENRELRARIAEVVEDATRAQHFDPERLKGIARNLPPDVMAKAAALPDQNNPQQAELVAQAAAAQAVAQEAAAQARNATTARQEAAQTERHTGLFAGALVAATVTALVIEGKVLQHAVEMAGKTGAAVIQIAPAATPEMARSLTPTTGGTTSAPV